MCVMRLVQLELYVRRVVRRRRGDEAARPDALAPLTPGAPDARTGACARRAPEGLAASYPGLRGRRRGSGDA